VEELSPRLLDFDPTRAAPTPRDAATVVVLRDTEGPLEIFCVRRHARSAFLGGALVFPGGKVDAADADDAWGDLCGPLHPRAARFAGGVDPRALAVAACRELLEEAGVVPLQDGSADVVTTLRRDLASGFASALRSHRQRLALDRLVPFGRWVTPEAESRRFDARFYLLELPQGQTPVHDAHEVTIGFWATPAAVLDGFARGDHQLAPPTTRMLEVLAHAHAVRGAFELAEAQSLQPICPRFVVDDVRGPYLALPGDPDHELREQRVAGATRFVLQDGRFVSAPAPAAPAPNSQGIRTSET
jgi:8-oxo-dGTP pyrophosphatase MutT (NUDIX family)